MIIPAALCNKTRNNDLSVCLTRTMSIIHSAYEIRVRAYTGQVTAAILSVTAAVSSVTP